MSASLSRRGLLLGGAATAGLSALAPSPAGAELLGPSGAWDIGELGDSITGNGTVAGDRGGGRVVFGGLSILGQALPLTRGRYRYSGTWAQNGATSSIVLASQLPQAVAARPRACLVIVGTNDIGRESLATSQANVNEIARRLMQVHTLPVLATIPPGNTYVLPGQQQQADSFNAWIREYARSRRLPLVDLHATVVDPRTGGYLPGTTIDGGHPSALGARLMAREVARVLLGITAARPTPLLTSLPPRGALIADVLHSRSGTWLLSGDRSSATYSRVRTQHWVGAKGTLHSRDLSNLAVVGRLTSQPVPGHRLRFASVLDARFVPPGASWHCLLVDRANRIPIVGYLGMTEPLTLAAANAIMAWEFRMPALPPGSDVVVQYGVQGPRNLVLGCAQTTLVDLTAAGVG